MLLSCVCLVVLAVASGQRDGVSRVVSIESGRVRGYKDADTGVFVFHGIPYATAPTGTDRFKPPLPPPAWQDVLEAVDNHVACPQNLMEPLMSQVLRQENCLIANIFVPDTTDKNIPVLVNVHGGAYQIGFGNLATLKQLVETKKIIVVNFNYRLGVHGFLCLGTKDVPGNAGMKDQVALLRWVNRNIAAFGGNPNEVTISGYSAGSSAVDLLQLSPSTKGLFKRVIPEGGSNLSTFSMQVDPLEIAKEFALASNFTNVDDIYALEKFYKTASFDLLTRDWFFDRKDGTFQFVPCVERDLGEETFFTESPFDILKKGDYVKLPMLYGFTDMEGLLKFAFFNNWIPGMNEDFSKFLPADLQFDNRKQKEDVARTVKEFYFEKEPISDSETSTLSFINYISDIYFIYGTLRSARLQLEAGNNQVYLYEYSYVPDSHVVLPSYPGIRGATHGGQVQAVYDGWLMSSIKSEDELPATSRKIKESMRELWLNFILTGNPVPEGSSVTAWPPMDAPGSPHMSLSDKMELRGSLLQERMRFWDDIYERHYRNPISPPKHSSPRTEL